MRPCSLLSLATAVPPHVVEQSEAKARAREAFGGKKALFDRLSGVFDNAGIARRHIVAPADWYMSSHGWHDRNALYLEATEQLFIDAAKAAIERAGITPQDIDGVVTVSTTGIATPSLEARVASRVGFRDNVRRVPVFGLGCAGGVNGLALASRLDGVWRLLRRAAGHDQRDGALGRIFAATAIVAGLAFTFWFVVIQGPAPTLAPH